MLRTSVGLRSSVVRRPNKPGTLKKAYKPKHSKLKIKQVGVKAIFL